MPRERDGEKKGERRKGDGFRRKLEKGRNNVIEEEMENEEEDQGKVIGEMCRKQRLKRGIRKSMEAVRRKEDWQTRAASGKANFIRLPMWSCV